MASAADSGTITSSSTPTTSPGTARATLGVLALGCVWYALQLALLLVPHVRAQSWQPTTGTVTSSGTHYKEYGDGDGGVIVLDIEYTYRVSNVEYHGTRYNLFENSLGQWDDAAYATARKFQIGAVVPVFFDPKHPANAAIDKALRPFHLVMVVLPLCLLTLGSWFFRRALAVPSADAGRA